WSFPSPAWDPAGGYIAGGAMDGRGELATDAQQRITNRPYRTVVARNGDGYALVYANAGFIEVRLTKTRRAPSGFGPRGLATTYGGQVVGTSVAAAWNGAHYVIAGTTVTSPWDATETLLVVTMDSSSQVVRRRNIGTGLRVMDAAPAANGRTLLLVLDHGS